MGKTFGVAAERHRVPTKAEAPHISWSLHDLSPIFGGGGLVRSSTAIVLVHNHPSGDPTPSRADIQMTKEIVAAAKPLDAAVHDHIIVGKQGHASFRRLGLI